MFFRSGGGAVDSSRYWIKLVSGLRRGRKLRRRRSLMPNRDINSGGKIDRTRIHFFRSLKIMLSSSRKNQYNTRIEKLDTIAI
jgi:hypothetical protein